VEFDQAVDGFGAAVAGAAGVEVGLERRVPLPERPAESLDLGDRAGRERGEDLLGDSASLGQVLALVGVTELLGALPGDVDLVMTLVGRDRSAESRALAVGELLATAVQDHPDPVERVSPAAPVATGLLLDAAADLIDRRGAQLHDMERVMPMSA